MVELVQPEKPRSRLKIYLDVLSAIQDEGEAKPTHILYKANLSYDRLAKYLEELAAKGLIVERTEGENRYFVLTQQGREFIREVRKAESFIGGFGLTI